MSSPAHDVRGRDRRGAAPGRPGQRSFVGERVLRALALVAAGASGAVLFALSEAGYASLARLGVAVALPGLLLAAAIAAIAGASGWHGLRRTLVLGAGVGVVATAGLEVVRIAGFRIFHAMPGSMPMLMGVLLTGRIMQGPDAFSNLVGWLDHLYNGVTFVWIYLLAFGRRRAWLALPYALLVGTGFLIGPVPKALGAGFFGAELGAKFAVTVYAAHIVFGGLLFLFARKLRGLGAPLLSVRNGRDDG